MASNTKLGKVGQGLLKKGFNKKKLAASFSKVHPFDIAQIQKIGKIQCLGLKAWPQIDRINAWMLSAETATFMKCGGLGMVASELPENFNKTFAHLGHKITIVTPMYEGNTGKKQAFFTKKTYKGTEGKEINVELLQKISVKFADTNDCLKDYSVEVYKGFFGGVGYIFLKNKHFFAIDPSDKNPSTQDGCYILNNNNVNEVERFAFFSKAIYTLLCHAHEATKTKLEVPNILLANDWHSGAIGGLCKYLTRIKALAGTIKADTAKKIENTPIIHIAHHLGYQGWDYENTARFLNALYEEHAVDIFKNAKAIKNSNPRAQNTLIVYDCYNQASANFHLADRIVTVSKNYMEEVSKELSFGFDFRDILKIRKNHRTFFGIVNGYEKNLISPNATKIAHINDYFEGFHFKGYDEKNLQNKTHNKKECIKLLSRIATDQNFKIKTIPFIDIEDFCDISDLTTKAAKIPFIAATSRMVEQKGYDTAASALLKVTQQIKDKKGIFPIIAMGGAGNKEIYKMLLKFREDVRKISTQAAKRIFIFRGYKDEFAYALQLATDFYLMPSHFEPCGLTQMEAMAKASLPIATSTGGLVDTIENGVDGFRTDVFFAKGMKVYGSNTQAKKFKNNINAYADTLFKALACFEKTPEIIKAMKINAMRKDFGWNDSVYKYYKLLKTGTL